MNSIEPQLEVLRMIFEGLNYGKKQVLLHPKSMTKIDFVVDSVFGKAVFV